MGCTDSKSESNRKLREEMYGLKVQLHRMEQLMGRMAGLKNIDRERQIFLHRDEPRNMSDKENSLNEQASKRKSKLEGRVKTPFWNMNQNESARLEEKQKTNKLIREISKNRMQFSSEAKMSNLLQDIKKRQMQQMSRLKSSMASEIILERSDEINSYSDSSAESMTKNLTSAHVIRNKRFTQKSNQISDENQVSQMGQNSIQNGEQCKNSQRFSIKSVQVREERGVSNGLISYNIYKTSEGDGSKSIREKEEGSNLETG